MYNNTLVGRYNSKNTIVDQPRENFLRILLSVLFDLEWEEILITL